MYTSVQRSVADSVHAFYSVMLDVWDFQLS